MSESNKKIKLDESVVEVDYEKLYQESLDLYMEQLKIMSVRPEDCHLYESSTHPMHPQTFFQLSCISGFNNLNGKNYPTYLNNWIKNHI